MKTKDCNGIFGTVICDHCEEYIECFRKNCCGPKSETITGQIKLDEKVRKELEMMIRDRSFTIFVQPLGDAAPVPVANVTQCDGCPDWLFEKVTKQILGYGQKGK